MRWLRVLSMSIVVVLAAFVGYYVFYLSSRVAHQHDRHLRGLGTVAGQIQGRLDNVAKVLRNAPYWMGKDAACDPQTVEDSEELLKACRGAAKQQLSTVSWLEFRDLKVLQPELPEARQRAGTSYRPTHEGSSYRLEFTSIEPLAGDENQYLELEAASSIEEAFPSLDHDQLFDELLIVDGAGEVILQRGNGLIRFTGIETLYLEPRDESDQKAEHRTLRRGRGRRHATDADAPDEQRLGRARQLEHGVRQRESWAHHCTGILAYDPFGDLDPRRRHAHRSL